MMSSAQEAPTL